MTASAAVGMRCTNCDEGLPAAARFCLSCGSPVVAAGEADVRKTVSLLFCDVTGSTAMGEQLDPEALREVMGRYFAEASTAVERHGGIVEKFVGDAVLAVFGIPEVREDDALRTVRAARDLRDALTALSDELWASMKVRLAVRTGVNTGSVVAGAARAGGSFATGDAVNTAARLEQAAAPGEVLLGATTLSLVRDAVEVEPVPALEVKGKAEPLPAYRLISVLDVEHGRHRRLDAVLVGRDREFRALTEALARTTEDGRGQLITVLGAAGMGKTRLVEHFLDEVGPGVQVLRGRCLSYGRGITFWPVVQLIRQAAGLSGEETFESASAALLTLLAGAQDADAALERLLPLLDLGGEPGGTEETFWAVRTLLEQLALRRPLVVVVDDVHWAEPTLLDLIERVRDESRDVPLLMVCQARPELLEQRAGWGGGALNATTFALEPFNGAQTAALLEGLLGPGLPTPVVTAIDGWADGNPLFVEEVATHLVEEGLLRRGPDGWEVSGDLTRVAVPATVAALLAARLDRLPPDERMLLERVSVVGLEVTTAEARALSDAGDDVASLLASLARRDLLRRGRALRPDTWIFRHVLVREAAYAALPKAVRAEMHERFAERLVEWAFDAGAEVAAFVGHHLEQAVRLRLELSADSAQTEALARRAVASLREAAAQARDVEDAPAATGLVRRALHLASAGDPLRRELLWQLAELQEEQWHITDALDSLEQVADLMDATTPDVDRAVLKAGLLALRSQAAEEVDPAELRAAAEAAAQLARQAHDEVSLARALRARVDADMSDGRWELAEDALRELDQVGNASDRRRAADFLIHVVTWGPKHVDEALALITASLEQPGRAAPAVAFCQVAQASQLAAVGRTGEAVALARVAERAAAAIDPNAAGQTSFFTVQAYVAAGDLSEALRVLSDGIDAHRRGGGLAFASTLLAWKAALLLERRGQEAEARRVVEEAAVVTSPYDRISVAMVEACRAVLAARRGDAAEAAHRAVRSIDAVDATDQDLMRADIRRWLSEVPARAGDPAAQRRLLVEALDLYRKKGHRPLTARTRRLLES